MAEVLSARPFRYAYLASFRLVLFVLVAALPLSMIVEPSLRKALCLLPNLRVVDCNPLLKITSFINSSKINCSMWQSYGR